MEELNAEKPMEGWNFLIYLLDSLKDYLFIKRGKGREGEKRPCVVVWLSPTRPLLGTWPAPQAGAQLGNQAGDRLGRRPALNPLSHTSQGCLLDS